MIPNTFFFFRSRTWALANASTREGRAQENLSCTPAMGRATRWGGGEWKLLFIIRKIWNYEQICFLNLIEENILLWEHLVWRINTCSKVFENYHFIFWSNVRKVDYVNCCVVHSWAQILNDVEMFIIKMTDPINKLLPF